MEKEPTYDEVFGEEKFLEVNFDGNFYNGMTGRLVHSFPKTVVLEFKLSSLVGGLQRVQFFKHQVKLRVDI